jgi:hypothetical protein
MGPLVRVMSGVWQHNGKTGREASRGKRRHRFSGFPGAMYDAPA